MSYYTIKLTFYTGESKNVTRVSVTDQTITRIVEQKKKEISKMYGVLESDIEVTREGLF